MCVEFGGASPPFFFTCAGLPAQETPARTMLLPLIIMSL